MPLVPVRDLLSAASKGGYAVGAFNCNNMEIVQAIVQAAVAEKSPVIIQASQGAIKYAGLAYIAALGRLAAQEASVPVGLHLDHGTSFEQAVRCIRHGFSSVMIDGSKFAFEDNIALTREVVKVAKAVGVSVEGELGKICGTEDDISVCDRDAAFTDPREAAAFVERTGIDSLAVAVGTAHGVYKGAPDLDFERLQAINDLVEIPLVLHGSSGVPDKDIREAIRRGVRKVNIDTDVRTAFVEEVRQVLQEFPKEIDPRKVLGPAREKMEQRIREKMRVFGSSGQS